MNPVLYFKGTGAHLYVLAVCKLISEKNLCSESFTSQITIQMLLGLLKDM